MRFFEHANYNIIRYRQIGYIISSVLILVSLVTVVVKGLQYGIDFRGGTELVVSLQEPVSVSELRNQLSEAIGSEPQVRLYGSARELQIRSTNLDIQQMNSLVIKTIEQAYPDNPARIIKSDLIGPTFAQDIRDGALSATIFSIIVIGIYILIRFSELSFMTSVILTLIHDTIIIIGLFTLLNGILPFNMDIDQNLVAALLTIIGYSLNDTIVVFDRIRENRLTRMRSQPWPELVNTSVNQTLSRTVVTSLTTLFVVTVLFVFGAASLKGFSFALVLGIILGTYSTIFFACPLVIDLPFKHAVPKRNISPARYSRS